MSERELERRAQRRLARRFSSRSVTDDLLGLGDPDCQQPPSVLEGGEGGIRTHGTVSRSGAFKAPALVHYATSPKPTCH
jgi:hypothetical protein